MNRRMPASAGRYPLRTIVKLMAGGLIAGSALAGCDTPEHQTDKLVQADVAAAQAARTRGDQTGESQARSALEKAAARRDVSPETQATAKAALAQVEVDAAMAQFQDVARHSVAANQLIGQIEELAQQVQQTHAATVAYDKYDPKPAHDKIAKDIADVQGSASQADWIKDQGTSIPSLTAVTQDISRLQGLIATQHDQQKSLEDHRTQVLGDADAASRSADASKGQQSVEEYKRSSDLRKQAGDLSTQIEKAQADTTPLEDQLKVAQGEQGVLQEAVKQMQEQSDALDTGWKALVDALTGQSALAKQIVVSSGNTPAPTDPKDTNAALFAAAGASLNEKSDALSKLLDQVKADRTQGEATMRNAIQHFTEAANVARTVYSAYGTKISDPANSKREEMISWQDLQNLYNPATYMLDAAAAQRQLAAMYLTELSTVVARQKMQQQVAQDLSGAALDVPPGLADTNLDAEKASAAAAADKELTAAIGALTNNSGGNQPALVKNEAKVDQMLAAYMQMQVAQMIGDNTAAKEHFDAAVLARDAATSASLPLPALPADLKAAPAATPASGT